MEISTGLNVDIRAFIVKGVTHYNSNVYASDGYCFYDKDEEIYDLESNLIENPELKQRTFMKQIITPVTDFEELKEKYISVLIEDDFDIV